MIVPRYWAESRHQIRIKNRRITVRRFGWSDTSESEAQGMAEARAKEALERIRSGESLVRRERKIPYNGADGLPIREEVVDQRGEAVLTRNSYGSLCINTPNVLFADVDYALVDLYRARFGWFAFLFLGVAVTFLIMGLTGYFNPLAPLAIFCLGWVAFRFLLVRPILHFWGGKPGITLARVRRFLRQHPDWACRVYQTPAGMRFLVTHQLFSPDAPLVSDFFDFLGTDPQYVRMCRMQHCFRARVSPKPWRIGMDRMRPQGGVWPVSAQRLEERLAWVRQYEIKALGYASCRFLETLGDSPNHPVAQQVIDWHDSLAQAFSDHTMA